jgi:protein TonB
MPEDATPADHAAGDFTPAGESVPSSTGDDTFVFDALPGEPHYAPPASTVAFTPPVASDVCESCGAPALSEQKLCLACATMFAPVLENAAAATPVMATAAEATLVFDAPVFAAPIDATDDAETETAFDADAEEDDEYADDEDDAVAFAGHDEAADIACETTAVGQTVPPETVELNTGEQFPVARQPWERRSDAAGANAADATNPDDQEPLPWWERRNEPEAIAAQPPVPPPPPIPAAPVFSTPATLVQPTMPAPIRAEEPRRPPTPRVAPRPPTPGVVTRPAQPPSRRRPMYVLGGSLVVALAMGVPVAKGWLRATPTVTLTDPGDFAAAKAPTTAADARPSPRSVAPDRSRSDAEKAPEEAVAPRTRTDVASRPAVVKGERPAHTVLARESQAPQAALVAMTTAPAPAPEPEPVAPPPPPVETVAAIPTGPVFEPGQVDDKPRVSNQVEPSVPDELRDRPLTDLVILRVLVSHAGRPSDVNVLRRSKSGVALDNAVIAAVRQWSFSPARKRGQAVNCWYNVGVPLRLDGRTSP